jgi:hypothetical protein
LGLRLIGHLILQSMHFVARALPESQYLPPGSAESVLKTGGSQVRAIRFETVQSVNLKPKTGLA